MANIFDYFEAHLGRAPSDESLRELPVDSGCGDDCKKAIDAAAALLAMAKMGGVARASDCAAVVCVANDTVEVFWRG